ncbi:MAG: cbb3-type cytochrome c oxidase subunit I [Acidobacteriia bacterium]|nr:cbb3-type cytochrome c oxidase subunit I [Terriglobia bacterium]
MVGQPVRATHAPAGSSKGFIRSYIFSTDHKVVGLQYFSLALAAVTFGIILSLLMRFHLVWPNAHLPFVGGGIMTPEQYLALVTMHGTIMVFFVLSTAPQSAFGNYFLPIQIGAPDMAFPTLNMLSFWLTLAAFLCMIAAFVVPGGAPISGWTAYPPLSGLGEVTGPGEGLGQTLWIVSISIFCFASLLGALNFIATTIDMRAPGMTLMRMPLTVWAWFVTSILSLLAFSVLLAGGILLLLDRSAGTSFFLPAGLVVNGDLQGHNGGSPLLWQHLFWFFGHPEVYIAILPGMGVVSHILANFSRKPVFGYRAMALALCAIGFLGFLVWGHHMFVSGMNPYSGLAFSVLTMSIGVPSAIKTFNWLGTLWGGKIQFHSPMLFAIGFVSFFVTGGLSGIFLAQPAVDTMLHATYYVVAHFHIVMGVAAVFGIFAATYYWFPKMFGRRMDERLGKLHFWLTFAGVYCVFMPMHFLGIEGGIRRYADSTGAGYLAALQPLHGFMTITAFITAAAQLIFFYNFFHSLKRGERATANPWNATTLEWITSSPPPPDNFGGHFPSVHRGPYEYSVPGEKEDFLPQNLGPEGGGATISREIPQRVYVTGMALLLGGVLMFFMALVSAYFVRKGFSSDWQPLAVPRVLWLGTLILLASSVTLARSRHCLLARQEEEFRHWWGATAILGVFFLAAEAIAWRQLAAGGVSLDGNPSGSFFYVFTAAHALHLLGGIVALLVVALRPTTRLTRRTATEVVSLYWHCMNALWVFLFMLLLAGA